jgi:Mrp family chromosome partitioning ATPase
MSSQIRSFAIPERLPNTPEAQPRRSLELPDGSALSPYGTLVQKLVQLRQKEPDGKVITFAAVAPGAGVTFVTQAVSWELARNAGQPVLVASPAALDGAQCPFRITEPIDRHKVWRLAHTAPAPRQAEAADAQESLRKIRERFGFILVDCPPLSQSSAIFSVAPISDGFVLVVAAGETRRSEIEAARRLLASTSVPLLGMVLNKQKSHVPKLLSAFF